MTCCCSPRPARAVIIEEVAVEMLPDWRGILRRAWSVRLMLLAGLLSAAEILLPFYADTMPRGMFAGLTIIVVTAALVARVMAQRGMQS